jgi:hypothetical protein
MLSPSSTDRSNSYDEREVYLDLLRDRGHITLHVTSPEDALRVLTRQGARRCGDRYRVCGEHDGGPRIHPRCSRPSRRGPRRSCCYHGTFAPTIARTHARPAPICF